MNPKLKSNSRITKQTASVIASQNALQAFADELADSPEDVFDAGVINPDPGMCPNCGGDLEDGDHTICSKF